MTREEFCKEYNLTEEQFFGKEKFEDAIVCYRVLTGACSFGVKDFVKKNEIKKKSYKIKEIAKLTEGSYGNKEFISYFELNK